MEKDVTVIAMEFIMLKELTSEYYHKFEKRNKDLPVYLRMMKFIESKGLTKEFVEFKTKAQSEEE